MVCQIIWTTQEWAPEPEPGNAGEAEHTRGHWKTEAGSDRVRRHHARLNLTFSHWQEFCEIKG